MRKVTNGRKYFHQQNNRLEGTAIMVLVGSPKRAAEHGSVPYEVVDGQTMNRVKFIPFEHSPVSGKKSRENFEKSLSRHYEKVQKYLYDKPSNYTSLDRFTKTSFIIKP